MQLEINRPDQTIVTEEHLLFPRLGNTLDDILVETRAILLNPEEQSERIVFPNLMWDVPEETSTNMAVNAFEIHESPGQVFSCLCLNLPLIFRSGFG